ncbi:hypothetical protein Tco_1449816 [Tanacetum coccineum]
MPPKMTTRSVGHATTVPRGGRMGGRTSRGGGRPRGRSCDQVNDGIDGQGFGSRLDTAHGYAVSSLMDMAYWSSE